MRPVGRLLTGFATAAFPRCPRVSQEADGLTVYPGLRQQTSWPSTSSCCRGVSLFGKASRCSAPLSPVLTAAPHSARPRAIVEGGVSPPGLNGATRALAPRTLGDQMGRRAIAPGYRQADLIVEGGHATHGQRVPVGVHADVTHCGSRVARLRRAACEMSDERSHLKIAPEPAAP